MIDRILKKFVLELNVKSYMLLSLRKAKFAGLSHVFVIILIGSIHLYAGIQNEVSVSVCGTTQYLINAR